MIARFSCELLIRVSFALSPEHNRVREPVTTESVNRLQPSLWTRSWQGSRYEPVTGRSRNYLLPLTSRSFWVSSSSMTSFNEDIELSQLSIFSFIASCSHRSWCNRISLWYYMTVRVRCWGNINGLRQVDMLELMGNAKGPSKNQPPERFLKYLKAGLARLDYLFQISVQIFHSSRFHGFILGIISRDLIQNTVSRKISSVIKTYHQVVL